MRPAGQARHRRLAAHSEPPVVAVAGSCHTCRRLVLVLVLVLLLWLWRQPELQQARHAKHVGPIGGPIGGSRAVGGRARQRGCRAAAAQQRRVQQVL